MTPPDSAPVSRLSRAGRRSALALGLTLAVLSGAHLARAAEPTPADKETARRLMTEGRAHRRDGDAKAALQSFVAADAIMHVPTTALEVARSEIDLGQLLEARDQLLAVGRLPDPGNEPRAFTEARETATTLSAELEPRIPSLLVKLQGAAPGANVKVTVDGVEVPSVALTSPRAVDPGHHVVAASVGSAPPKEAAVDVKEGESKDVSIDLASVDVVVVVPPPKPKPSDGDATLRLASYVGFGVGGAGLLVGGITGIVAITSLSAAKKQGCVGNECPPSASSDLSTSHTMATVSTVGFVVGGVGVAGGVVAFLLSRRATSSSRATDAASRARPVTAVPYIGPGSLGVTGTF